MRTALAFVLSTTIPAVTLAQPAPVAVVESGPETAGYGVGLRARYVALPEWFLGIFTDESVALHSAAFGGEFTVRRSPEFDWVFAAEYMFASPPDGNWLGNGEPTSKTDYIAFDNFGIVNVDASAVWNQKFSPWFTLTYGLGLGVGIPTGSAVQASSTRNGDEGTGMNPDGPDCSRDDLDDLDACHPPGCGDDGICSDRELELMRDQRDPHNDPDAEAAAFDLDVWPVIPVVNLMIGARFTVHRNFEIRVDGGFHNALFLGSTLHYLF
jgi:hypothetical protein